MMNFGESGDLTSSTPAPDAPPAAPPAPAAPPVDTTPVAVVEEKTPPSVGLWECLNEPSKCKLAAPDARTAGTFFEGPVQGGTSLGGPVECPECGGQKVIYRGDKSA